MRRARRLLRAIELDDETFLPRAHDPKLRFRTDWFDHYDRLFR